MTPRRGAYGRPVYVVRVKEQTSLERGLAADFWVEARGTLRPPGDAASHI